MILIILLFSSLCYASPISQENVIVPDVKIAEDFVKDRLGFTSDFAYVLVGNPGINMQKRIWIEDLPKTKGFECQEGEFYIKNGKRIVIFDGEDTNVLVHELAHVYGADEQKADEITWAWRNK